MAINQISSLRMGNKFKKTPIGEIPMEWEIGVLGDIATLGRGRVISKVDLEENPGPYPVYSSQSKEKGIFGYLASFDFDGDYVTWTTDGAYAGSVFFRSGKFNCTNVCGTIKVKEESKINPQFLALTLSTRTAGFVSHVGNPKLMNNVMAKIPIILPPISEQTKIAEILSSIDDAIEKADSVISKTRDLKKALMQRLLTRGIAHTKFKKTPIGEIPVEWEVSRLGDIAGMFSGGTPSRNRPEYFGGGIPWVKSGELNPGYVTATEETISEQGLNASSAKWVTENSILLALYGATAGQIALLKIKATINQAVLAIIPKEEAIHTSFLYYALRAQIERLISITQGSGQPNLNQDVVSSLELTIPPFAEQKKIAKILSSVDDAIEISESERGRLEQTKKSLMADLLTGRVRTV